MIEKKESETQQFRFNYLNNKLIEKLFNLAYSSPIWKNFKPTQPYNWFEKTFCKNIIQHIEWIERNMPSKKITWK